MKKIGDLMKELGFNSKASVSVQEAFIKHLVKASHGVYVMTPSEKKEIQNNPQKIISLNRNHSVQVAMRSNPQSNVSSENSFQQMSFDFIIEDQTSNSTKASAHNSKPKKAGA